MCFESKLAHTSLACLSLEKSYPRGCLKGSGDDDGIQAPYVPHHTIGDDAATKSQRIPRNFRTNTSVTYADVCCRMLTVYGLMLTYADLAGELGTALTQDSRR